MKKKFLVSGFDIIGKVIESYTDEYEMVYTSFPSTMNGVLKNMKYFREMKRSHKLEAFDVVYLSSWESIQAYKKMNPQQVCIAELHGFVVGINYDQTIKEVPFVKRQMHKILKFTMNNKMMKKYREPDILYVSTPNMIKHALKIRKDAIWLPNPINTKVFNTRGPKIRLEGNPAIFLPTRLHAFKNPLFGINLFSKIKKKYPEAKLHIINYGQDMDPLFEAFKRIVDDKDVVYHKLIPRTELAKYYRSADLVLGQFNVGLGNFSLVELEAMACGAPIVTLDVYELKQEFDSLDKLEGLAFRIISDKKFRNKFVRRNREYVYKYHSEESVAKTVLKDIARVRIRLNNEK